MLSQYTLEPIKKKRILSTETTWKIDISFVMELTMIQTKDFLLFLMVMEVLKLLTYVSINVKNSSLEHKRYTKMIQSRY